MYAGAAREAVFSNPDVIRKINAQFVPLALRATLVNGADAFKDEDEKWLYQRINRAKLLPQGICILSSTGQVLLWVQMFDSNQGVLDFLDAGLKRFQEKQPLVTERYVTFPTDKAKGFEDQAKPPAIAAAHPKGKACPSKDAKGKSAPGALAARLVGRALDDQGQPRADVVNQEHYVEDQFIVPPETQALVAQACAKGGKARLPDAFAKLCASHAHLGHIDVRPLFGPADNHKNKGEWKKCEFFAQAVASRERERPEQSLWRIEGQSEVVSEVAINGTGVHDVELAWEGFIELQGERMTRLLLSARGREKLQFAKDDHPLKKLKKDEVACLPGGRPIDLQGGVRYGILGELVPPDEAGDAPAKPAAVAPIPDEARRHLVEAFGPAFLVFRDKVQDELKLSDQEKQKLEPRLQETIQDARQFFQKIDRLKPEERRNAHQAYRRKAQEKLAAFLKDNLKHDQLRRLRQLERQQEGLFALMGQPDLAVQMKITDEQRKRVMAVIQELEKKVQPLIQEADSGGNPEEIRPKVMKIRKEHEGKLEAILSKPQKKQWQEMLGKPFELGD